jgi:hypothetical protein
MMACTDRWMSIEGVRPPHVIYYRFKNPLTVTKVAFKADGTTYAPTDYQIVASKAENCDSQEEGVWESLVQREDVKWSENEVKTEVIAESKRGLYRCYGIKSIKSSHEKDRVILKKIRMWKIEGKTEPVATPITPTELFRKAFGM